MRYKSLFSPTVRTGLKLLAAVSITELLIMAVFSLIHIEVLLSPSLITLIDVLTLSAVASVTIFYWVVKPMKMLDDLRKAEKSLRAAAFEWRNTFDSMKDGIMLLDNKGKILRSNRSMAELLGKQPGELVGHQCWEVVHGSLDCIANCPLQTMKNSRKREIHVLPMDSRWFEVTVDPFFDSDGNLIGAVHLMSDITERKHLEDALKAAVVLAEDEKAKADSIIAAIGDGITIQDRDFRILYQNQAAKNLVGDHFGELCYMAYEKREKRCEGCPVAQVFEDGGVHTAVRSAPTDKGTMFFEIIASPLLDSKGKIVAGIEVVHDITERKRNEEALRASEEMHRLIFQRSPVGIFHYDAHLHITDCNDRFVEILQTKREKLIGLDMTTLSDQSVLPSLRDAITGKEGRYEGFYKTTTSNAEIWVSIGTAPLFTQDGTVKGGIGIVEDVTGRKLSETALKESELKFRSLTEKALVGTYIFQDNVFKYVNPRFIEIFGYSDEELIGRMGPLNLTLPEDHALVEKNIRKRQSGEVESVQYEFRGVRKDGQIINIELLGSNIMYQGRIAVIGTLLDITGRKLIEEQLSQVTREWEETFNTITDMVTVHDKDFNIIRANKAAQKILGLPFLNVKKVKCFEYFHGTGCPPEGCPSCKSLVTGKPSIFELFEPHLNMYLEIQAIPRLDSNNQVVGLIHVVRDITERKKAEEARASYSQELTSLNMASDTLMLITNLRDIYQEICNIIYTVFDLKMVWLGIIEEGSFQVKPVAYAGREDGYLSKIRVTWDDSPTGMGPTGMAIKTMKSHGMKVTDPAYAPWSGAAQQRGYVASLSVPLIYARDKCIGALNFYSDDPDYFTPDRVRLCQIFANQAAIAIENARLVEELEGTVQERTRRLEDANMELHAVNQELVLRREEADAASRSKTDFLANMSHELRTPLNSIMGFSDIMQQGMAGPVTDKQKEFLNDISESGNHLLTLITDILDLSKIEAGKLELELSTFSLKELIEGSLVMFKQKALKHAIKVTTEIEDTITSITADQRKLKQVLVNLLSNAFKFTPDRGSVHVQARGVRSSKFEVQGSKGPNLERGTLNIEQNRDFVEISVSDTGIGISKENQQRLFQPFQQIETSLTRKYAGTGLGLSLCRRLIELHGGKIWVESESGKGSRFVFIIPMKQ